MDRCPQCGATQVHPSETAAKGKAPAVCRSCGTALADSAAESAGSHGRGPVSERETRVLDRVALLGQPPALEAAAGRKLAVSTRRLVRRRAGVQPSCPAPTIGKEALVDTRDLDRRATAPDRAPTPAGPGEPFADTQDLGRSVRAPDTPAGAPVAEDDAAPGDPTLQLPDYRRLGLTVLTGTLAGLQLPISRPLILIGRDAGDVVVAEPDASTPHAAIEIHGAAVVLRDLDSRCHTFVNGARITATPLNHLDEIRIGHTVLLFTAVDAWPDTEEAVAAVPEASPAPAPEAVAPPPAEVAAPPAEAPSPTPEYPPEPQPEAEPAGSPAEPDPLARDDPRQTRRWRTLGSPPIPAAVPVRLLFRAGPLKGNEIALDRRETVLGRDQVDIVLPDPDVSRRHLHIEIAPNGHVSLKDLGSSNGTYVNDRRVSYTEVHDGDTVSLGGSTFVVAIGRDG